MIIQRDYMRTTADDFALNVECVLRDSWLEAIPIHHPTEGYVVGWKIQRRYE